MIQPDQGIMIILISAILIICYFALRARAARRVFHSIEMLEFHLQNEWGGFKLSFLVF